MTDVLVDADLYLFRAAQAVELEIDWGNDLWTLHSHPSDARRAFDASIEKLLEKLRDSLKIGQVVFCFGDPTRATFRHDLCPEYKAKRKRKPLAYNQVRDQIIADYKAVWKPRLEADDCLGIISTRAPGRYIIATEDKDMQGIPGLIYRDGKITEITEEQADKWHMVQTLTGDPVDGYSGCPGIGKSRAEKLLSKRPWWPRVVGAFKQAGLTEDDALLQARLARILRASDWNFDTSEIILWTPPDD